jgi:cyclic pyranopterin phosphate synthase
MPMREIYEDRTDRWFPLSELRAAREKQFTFHDRNYRTGGPARYIEVAETGRRLGFITPMTHNFCEPCNRVRLTCTGPLYMCLGQNDAADPRSVLRRGDTGHDLWAAIDDAVSRKPKGHAFVIDRANNRPVIARHMRVTGGQERIRLIRLPYGSY